VLDLLTQLVNKSLVQVAERDGEARYHMLETIRQFAFDRLVEAAEMAQMRDRHLDYYCKLVEEARPHLIGPQQLKWFNRLEAEYANLRAVMEWSLEGKVLQLMPGRKWA